MAGRARKTCHVCGSENSFSMADDGFFYCGLCGSQSEDIIDTGVDEEAFFKHYAKSCSRVLPTAILAEPLSQVNPTASQFLDHPNLDVYDGDAAAGEGFDISVPGDFGSSSQRTYTYEQYYTEIRSRYLSGLQIMIQLQFQVLVERYNVSPLIIGLVGPLWLRFVSYSKVMSGEWADQAVHDSESKSHVEVKEFKPSANVGEEPRNIDGKRLVNVWYYSLRKEVPVSITLAFSFLACHVAREAILPSDILKWTLEGKFPYFSAFHEVVKKLGARSGACPVLDSVMFRPSQSISSQKLESMAATIARKIFLELPPVNFYAIASRYCKKLCLPERELLPTACKICDWAMPPELYLSANERRIPTRASVVSALIIAIRILSDINGYGVLESAISNLHSLPRRENEKNSSEAFRDVSKFIFGEFLKILEEKYVKLDNAFDFQSDLQTYLQYCKEMVFSGLWPSYEDVDEDNLMYDFWDFYKDKERSDDEETAAGTAEGDHEDDREFRFGSWKKEKALMQLKLDMEENGFLYIPPRVRVKRKDYLHYARRRKDVYLYAVHADYYILLRSCAVVAEVEARALHTAVLSLERRLCLLEKKVERLVDPFA